MIGARARRAAAVLSAAALLTGMGPAAAPADASTPAAALVSSGVAGTASADTAEPPEPPDYAPPTLNDVSADTMRQVRLADGEGSQVAPGSERHVQIESPAHFEAAPYEAGQDVDLWIIPPDGANGQYFGRFEVRSEDEPDRYWSYLGPVTFPPETFDYSGMYAAALTDQDGELLAWQRTVLELDGEEVTAESPGGTATGTWPVPDSEVAEPVTEPPALEDLIGEGYGRVYIEEETPAIPLDRPFTVVFHDTTQPADYWLLPAGGSEAIWLPKEDLTTQEAGEVHASLILTSEDVEFTGIYALAAKNLSGSLIGWAPFGISVDGEGIRPEDPGVNSENPHTDRSIFPIPDSVPVPEANGNDTEEEQTQASEPAASPTSEAAEDEDPAAGQDDSEAAAETEGSIGWAAAAAIAGGLLVAGPLYLVISRRRASS